MHTSYFDVAEFRKIIAAAIGQSEGFRPSLTFEIDSDFERVAVWLADLGRRVEIDPASGTMIAAPQPSQSPVTFPA